MVSKVYCFGYSTMHWCYTKNLLRGLKINFIIVLFSARTCFIKLLGLSLLYFSSCLITRLTIFVVNVDNNDAPFITVYLCKVE